MVIFHRLRLARLVRRLLFALLLGILVFSAGVRIRSYLLTRKIQAVLSGLARVRVDQTTGQELLRTTPYLSHDPALHYFDVHFTNLDDFNWMGCVPAFLLDLWPERVGHPFDDKMAGMALPMRVAYMLGWRYLSFSASVLVSNGTVSKIEYTIEPDVFFGYPASGFIQARTVHGYRRDRRPLPVDSTGEDSPDFRFGAIADQFTWLTGADQVLAVAYTASAPQGLVTHVFQVDLSCFWGIRGCDSVRRVAPLLWQDREKLAGRTAARFASRNPCPDELLAGRVRTLPDLSIALLEVVHSGDRELNYEGDRRTEIATDYRLVDAILGEPKGPWTGIMYRDFVPLKYPPGEWISNPIPRRYPTPGERFLFFGGAAFDSCRIVPATESAESAVRNASRALKRSEDYVMGGRS